MNNIENLLILVKKLIENKEFDNCVIHIPINFNLVETIFYNYKTKEFLKYNSDLSSDFKEIGFPIKKELNDYLVLNNNTKFPYNEKFLTIIYMFNQFLIEFDSIHYSMLNDFNKYSSVDINKLIEKIKKHSNNIVFILEDSIFINGKLNIKFNLIIKENFGSKNDINKCLNQLNKDFNINNNYLNIIPSNYSTDYLFFKIIDLNNLKYIEKF